jgi:hypothetical protein
MLQICILCNSSHCKETNMDGTVGCCICFNKQIVQYNEDPISLCDGCNEYVNRFESLT